MTTQCKFGVFMFLFSRYSYAMWVGYADQKLCASLSQYIAHLKFVFIFIFPQSSSSRAISKSYKSVFSFTQYTRNKTKPYLSSVFEVPSLEYSVC